MLKICGNYFHLLIQQGKYLVLFITLSFLFLTSFSLSPLFSVSFTALLCHTVRKVYGLMVPFKEDAENYCVLVIRESKS